MKFDCEYCGKENDKYAGHVNRARRLGRGLYCDRLCSGLGRRHNKSEEEQKSIKRGYDQMYRKLNKKKLKTQKAAAYKINPHRDREKAYRDANKEHHAAYIRTPKYKAWKKKYDLKFLAKKNYGEHWESAVLLRQIRNEVDNYEAKLTNGLLGKSQQRKRDYVKLNSERLER